MKYFKLRNSDIEISNLILGTWSVSGAKAWGPADEDTAIKMIRDALDLGITGLDTAEKYGDGNAELLLGRALKGIRQRAVLCTKVYSDALRYDDVIAHCEDSLKRLQTDYIDLYQIHWPSKTIPLGETMEAMEKLKEQGKIRAYGACNFAQKSLADCSDYTLATNQLPYSLLWRLIENTDVAARCEREDIAVLAYAPLAQGLLSGKYRTVEDVPLSRRETRLYSSKWGQCLHTEEGFEDIIFPFLDELRKLCSDAGCTMTQLAYAFVLSRTFIPAVIIGAKNTEQVQTDINAALYDAPADLLAAADKLSFELKEKMGNNIDLWQNKDGGRFI